MTSDPRRAGPALLALLLAASTAPARAAEPYPFEGTWVRANRVCTAGAPRTRSYTAKEVTFATGRCGVTKVASSGSSYEIFEDCRRAEKPGRYTETIRMLGPDLMQMRRQAARLKIARPLRFVRCTIAGAEPPRPAVAMPRRPVAEPRAAETRAPDPGPAGSKPPEPAAADSKPADAKP